MDHHRGAGVRKLNGRGAADSPRAARDDRHLALQFTDEIDHCRWWLDAEIAQVRPKLILAMGATAAQSLTGNGAQIRSRRGKIERGPDGLPVLITLHPSYLLRVPDAAAREKAKAQFKQDLVMAAEVMTQDAG